MRPRATGSERRRLARPQPPQLGVMREGRAPEALRRHERRAAAMAAVHDESYRRARRSLEQELVPGGAVSYPIHSSGQALTPRALDQQGDDQRPTPRAPSTAQPAAQQHEDADATAATRKITSEDHGGARGRSRCSPSALLVAAQECLGDFEEVGELGDAVVRSRRARSRYAGVRRHAATAARRRRCGRCARRGETSAEESSIAGSCRSRRSSCDRAAARRSRAPGRDRELAPGAILAAAVSRKP